MRGMKGLSLVRRASTSSAASGFVDRAFVTKLELEKSKEIRPMYRVMDRAGKVLDSAQDPDLPKGSFLSVLEKVFSLFFFFF